MTANNRLIHKTDLTDQIDSLGPHPVLHCDQCNADFSANASDYFWS